MRLKFATLLLAFGLCTLPAAAADYNDLRAIRQACGNDIHALCAGVGQGRIAQCMMAHADAVSPGCASALKAIKARLQSAGQSQMYDTD